MWILEKNVTKLITTNNITSGTAHFSLCTHQLLSNKHRLSTEKFGAQAPLACCTSKPSLFHYYYYFSTQRTDLLHIQYVLPFINNLHGSALRALLLDEC